MGLILEHERALGKVSMEDVERFLRKGIAEIKAYAAEKPIEALQVELGLQEIVSMGTNENPLGPSPKAMEAMKRELERVNLYPDAACTALVNRLAGRLEVAEDMIAPGNGADNCITMIGSAFINEGDEVLMADPTFPVYTIAVKIMGGTPVYVSLKNYVHDLNAMQKRVGPRTKLVFVCNPNNPTGSIVEKEELDDFVKKLPPHVLLVLDEAYHDFVEVGATADALDYIKTGYNVISLRTFSKLYGLAGLRIGYALGRRELISALKRVREVFPVSRLAQAAALAALEDDAFKAQVLENNEQGKAFLYEAFEELALPYVPSHTNFIFVDFKTDAGEVAQVLQKRGFLIRPGHGWGGLSFARVTIGTIEQNRKFIDVLKDALNHVQK